MTKFATGQVQQLFAGLLGRGVRVSAAKPTLVLGTSQWVVGIYHDDRNQLAGLGVADMSLANLAGSALSLLPADDALLAARAETIHEEVLENFREILNVGASLYPNAGGVHVRIVETVLAQPKLSPDYTKLLRKSKARLDSLVDIEGYGKGKMSFIAAA